MTLEIITSDLLAPRRHGFFSRKGGASSGIFLGLNCGYGSSDQSEIVQINRARVAKALQVPAERLLTLHQTHSRDVVTFKGDMPQNAQADGLVTSLPGYAIAVLTADCQPILFADHQAGVIGAAHAGWRGAIGGVIEATVVAMENAGAQRERIVAAIGPCLSQQNYEVGPEFYDAFITKDPASAALFSKALDDKYLFDLPQFGLNMLAKSGVGQCHWTGHCTYGDPDMFFSYRRSCHTTEADYGRLISAIRL